MRNVRASRYQEIPLHLPANDAANAEEEGSWSDTYVITGVGDLFVLELAYRGARNGIDVSDLSLKFSDIDRSEHRVPRTA